MKSALGVLVFCLLSFVSSSRAACPETPGGLAFDLTGPDCLPEKQLLPCACSEGMSWSPVEGAEWYQILRTQLPNGPASFVGTTYKWNRPGEPRLFWYFAFDCIQGGCFFPQEGMTYTYQVRGCKATTTGATLCSTTWGDKVTYVASAYYCYNNGAKVPCF